LGLVGHGFPWMKQYGSAARHILRWSRSDVGFAGLTRAMSVTRIVNSMPAVGTGGELVA
jgi:hypothetical protein